LFSHAFETALQVCGSFESVIEVGPNPTLKRPASEVLEQVTSQPIPYIGTLSRGKNDIESFTDALGAIWTKAGTSALDFSRFQSAVYDDSEKTMILRNLPPYPWNHDRVLWSESRYTKLLRQQAGGFHDLLGTRTPDGTEEEWRWRNILAPKELPWLTDHGLQGQIVFAAMGYVALAMEAARQIAGQQPVQLLELTDLSIRKAVAIDEMAGTETLVTMTDIKQTEHHIQSLFSFFSAAGKDSSMLTLNATGQVRIQLGNPLSDMLPPRTPGTHKLAPVDMDDFYIGLEKIGYNYGPSFRGTTSLRRRLGFSSGAIIGPSNNPTGTPLLFHPGVLDAALQGLLAAFSSPGDGRLWSLHAPYTIRRVSLVPSLCGANMTKELYFDCAVTSTAFNNITGDVDVFQSDNTQLKSIAIEGISFVPFSAATIADDRYLFARNIWEIESPDGELALGARRASLEEAQKGYDAERVSFYYLRALNESVDRAERASLELQSHHEALLDYAEHICDVVRRGEHKYVKSEWMNDTYTDVCSIMEK
jgi:acyl transferase domain-containing protein